MPGPIDYLKSLYNSPHYIHSNLLTNVVAGLTGKGSGEGYSFPPINTAILPSNPAPGVEEHEGMHLQAGNNPQRNFVIDQLWLQDHGLKPKLPVPQPYEPIGPTAAAYQMFERGQ